VRRTGGPHIWCMWCNDAFDIDHGDGAGGHLPGEDFGPYGAWLTRTSTVPDLSPMVRPDPSRWVRADQAGEVLYERRPTAPTRGGLRGPLEDGSWIYVAILVLGLVVLGLAVFG
jgi:hypothetical protein